MPYLVEKLKKFGHKVMRAYGRWRIGPTPQELHAYNRTDRILLTFDDFADEVAVNMFLSILRGENVKAAFFLVGEWAREHKILVKRIKDEGHWVGNHTFLHRNLAELSSDEVEKEIGSDVRGELLRPPYGIYNSRIREVAARVGYHIAFWTIDSDDWRGLSAEEIQKRIFDELHPGACVLLHLNGPHTLEALPGLIKGIRERGFELCSDSTEITL